MSENDYTSDGNWQTLLDQILAQQQGTATNQPVATQTKTTPDNTIAQQTMTTPQDLNTMSPQQVHEAVMNNPNLYSQEALDAYARQNNLGAPPTGGVPYSRPLQNDIATGRSITTAPPFSQDASNMASLFDSILNSSQGTSALGEIASGTGTTTATTEGTSTTPGPNPEAAQYYANLYGNGIDSTKSGQPQSNLNNANNYRFYYSPNSRKTQV